MQTEQQPQAWSGRSDNISVPILGAEFWQEGAEITGTLEGYRIIEARGDMKAATGYRLRLDMPVALDGDEIEAVELVSSLSGVKFALQDLKAKGYTNIKVGDRWHVTCTGIKKAKREGYNDSPEFGIDVTRGVAPAKAAEPAKATA